MSKTNRLALVAVCLLVASSAQAAVTFQFNYTDAGVGFNDMTLGADRRAALEASADVVEGLLTAYSATIFMDVNGAETNDSTLAAAGSNFNGPFGPGFAAGNRGDVGQKVLGMPDPNPMAADGTVTWNFEDHNWDLDDMVAPGAFDFKSTAIHELLHALGFSSDIAQNGNDGFGNTPGNPGMWNPFAKWVGDDAGPVIDHTTFALDGSRWNAASTGGTGSVPATPNSGQYFHGPNAKAANGGNPVPIYSPNPWEGGSSGSHTDDAFYTGSNQLIMNAATNTGMGIRTVSPLEIGIFRDLGFTQFAVPEPSSLMIVLVGLASLCGCRSRTRG